MAGAPAGVSEADKGRAGREEHGLEVGKEWRPGGTGRQEEAGGEESRTKARKESETGMGEVYSAAETALKRRWRKGGSR